MTIYVMFHNMCLMTIIDSAFLNIICFSFDGETRVYYFKKKNSSLRIVWCYYLFFGFLNEKQNKKEKTKCDA